MDVDIKTIGFDGNDEIIFSQSFNVYENELLIKDSLGKSFKFIFEKSNFKEGQKDINITWDGDKATITLSKKFRSTLGSATTSKLPILKTGNQQEVLLSIFGQQIGGGDLLNITVNFYLR